MNIRIALLGVAAGLLLAVASSTPAQQGAASGRLYALDCGRIDFKDLAIFSDTGDYDGKAGSIPVPCYVIRHPKGLLLWDAGLGDQLVGHPAPATPNGIQLRADTALTAQLKTLGLTPGDFTYIAFSHFHLDHTGNANLFARATWIINQSELDWATGKSPPPIVDMKTLSAYKTAKTRMIAGDEDVFGDGSVRILKTPGHTPGHQALMLKLTKSGTVILSGDLYHFRSDRTRGLVMTANTDRAATLASFNRIEALVKNAHARLIIQHDPQDFAAFPKFPAYLD